MTAGKKSKPGDLAANRLVDVDPAPSRGHAWTRPRPSQRIHHGGRKDRNVERHHGRLVHRVHLALDDHRLGGRRSAAAPARGQGRRVHDHRADVRRATSTRSPWGSRSRRSPGNAPRGETQRHGGKVRTTLEEVVGDGKAPIARPKPKLPATVPVPVPTPAPAPAPRPDSAGRPSPPLRLASPRLPPHSKSHHSTHSRPHRRHR
jgi:hypothetical protein